MESIGCSSPSCQYISYLAILTILDVPYLTLPYLTWLAHLELLRRRDAIKIQNNPKRSIIRNKVIIRLQFPRWNPIQFKTSTLHLTKYSTVPTARTVPLTLITLSSPPNLNNNNYSSIIHLDTNPYLNSFLLSSHQFTFLLSPATITWYRYSLPTLQTHTRTDTDTVEARSLVF